MTPQQSWIWILGYIFGPLVFARIVSALAYMWLGEEIYRGPRFSLVDIFQFWALIIGYWVMIDLAVRIET